MTEVESNYIILWCIYLLAVVGAMVVVRRFCSALKLQESAAVVRIIVLVILITPAKVDPELGFWAPAFMALFMDAIAVGIEPALSRLWPILIVLVISLGLSFSWRLVSSKRAG